MTAVVIAFVAGVSAGLSMRGYNPCDNHPIAQLNQQFSTQRAEDWKF